MDIKKTAKTYYNQIIKEYGKEYFTNYINDDNETEWSINGIPEDMDEFLKFEKMAETYKFNKEDLLKIKHKEIEPPEIIRDLVYNEIRKIYKKEC